MDKNCVDMTVEKVFIAYEDDRLSTISHYCGPDGLRELVEVVVKREKLESSTSDYVYEKVMEILDEIAINKNSVTSQHYITMYMESVLTRLHDLR